MENITLPTELNLNIGSENKDFAVKAGRAQPLKVSVSLIVFGVIWTAFSGLFATAFFGPLFLGKEVHFKTNGVSVVASPDNLGPLLLPGAIIAIFLLIGFGLLILGIYNLFRSGGYFIGTPTRLIHYQKGNIRSVDWEQFSGDVEVSGNLQKGNLSLKMRTGKNFRRKNGRDGYTPDVIYISAVPNVFELEQICRKRIKENDPTPPSDSPRPGASLP